MTATYDRPKRKPPVREEGDGKSRVLLVDDHPIVRQGVAAMLNQQPDISVCGTAEDPHQALETVAKLKPDLVIVDLSLKKGSGIDLLKDLKVRYPKLLTLVLSMHDESLYALRVLRAGASGYIMKQAATENVLVAVRRVLAGEVYLSEEMGKRMMEQIAGKPAKRSGSPIEDLSDRELQVFNMIGQGRGTRQIAEELHLSVKTIESHRARIKDKLNLQTGAELVQHAIQWRQA
jgi:DNA-binding NarL/FixJ family response regulator